MATELEIAWAAGLFEGEGYVVARENEKRRGVGLGITMTDRDVVERFARVVGVGLVHEEAPKEAHYKLRFKWRIAAARDVERISLLLLPHLGERRTARIFDALEIAAKISPTKGPKRWTKCRNGHPLVGQNVRTSRYGKRRCRICAQRYRRAYEARKKDGAMLILQGARLEETGG